MTYKSHVLRILRGRRQRKIRIKLGWNHKSEFQNLYFNVCVNELFHNILQLSTYTGSPVRLTELKFLLSLSAKQYGNPYLGSHLCTRIWVYVMIGLLKKTLLICQSGWREFVESIWGQEQGYWGCFVLGLDSSVTQARYMPVVIQ